MLEREPVQPAPGHEAISHQATCLMLWAFLRPGSLGLAGKARAETRRQAGPPCPKTAQSIFTLLRGPSPFLPGYGLLGLVVGDGAAAGGSPKLL